MSLANNGNAHGIRSLLAVWILVLVAGWGGPEVARAQAGCAAGISGQSFSPTMTGCPGVVSWADRDTLCAAGWSACSAAAWVEGRAGQAPSANYWTDDDLRFNGNSSACFVDEVVGDPLCSGRPMRVCAASPDVLGNTCNWLGCGYQSLPPPNEFFGGCANDLTAGTLCCQNEAAFVPGDVNSDGVFDVADSTVLRRALADLPPGITQVGSSCGNGAVDGDEQCDGGDLAGATCERLGYTAGGTLSCTAGCAYDTNLCESQAFPATGQVTCWDSTETVIPCAGTGHDGDVRAGAALAYQDNGDGTITDLNTGLMWEKLSDDSSVHDWDNAYTWDQAFLLVGLLNSGGFAGHTDWRLPNAKELFSILNMEVHRPAVSPAFDTGCAPGCSVLTCSCTSFFYWSSSSSANFPLTARVVNFAIGEVDRVLKGSVNRVRAVRGP